MKMIENRMIKTVMETTKTTKRTKRVKRMMGMGRTCIWLAAVFVLFLLCPISIQAKNEVTCKSLCGEALQATGGSGHLKYKSASALDFGALSASARKKVQEIQYVCDAKEAYSLCVMRTETESDAKALLKRLKKYKKNNNSSDYLADYSADEQKVFKNAVCGRMGNYAWYISMSAKKSDNNKGQKAIRKKL